MSQAFSLKIEHLVVALFFIAILPHVASAQGVGSEGVEGVVVANIQLSDAAIISHEPGKIKIGFSLSNEGKSTQLDIRYGFELVKTTDGTQTIVDTFVSPETLVLTPGQTLMKEVDYFAPTFLSGEYKVYVIAKTTGGLMLGLGKAGEVTFSENAPFIEIVPESCVLSIGGDGKKYTLYQGVDISVGEKLSVICDIENHFDSARNISQYYETFRRSLYGESVDVSHAQKDILTLLVGERKTVSFVVPTASNPQAYDTTLVLVDTDTQTPISNKISFHYVVRGESATIQNVSFDNSSYVKGDPISANVSWTPSADQFPGSRAGEGTTLNEVTALLNVTDVNGNVCANSNPKIISVDSLNFTITASAITDCVNPSATITLIDKDHNELDSMVVGSLGQGESFQELLVSSSVQTQSNFGMYVSVIGLTLLIISGLIFAMKRKKHYGDVVLGVHNPYKLLIYILLLSSSFFAGAGQVSAVTFSGQGSIWQFTANSNKSSYSPNETISLDSSIYANVCGNTAADTYLEATFEGQTISLQSGEMSGGQTLYGGGQFSAPATPGVYLIVLKGCGGDLCYANPPQGVFYSSLPISVVPPPMSPTAWWSPSNITIAQGGTYSMGYASLNATHCDIWKNGVLVSTNAPTWYFYNNILANEPSYTSKLVCYNSKGNPSAPVNFTLTVLQPAVNASCGSADGVQTSVVPTTGLCSAGSQSSVADNANSFNWSCFGQAGGSNDSCSAPKPSTVTADVSATNCVIPVNGSSCSVSVTWSSLYSNAPSVRQDGDQFSILPSSIVGTNRNIGYGTHVFSFYNNNTLIASDFADAFCDSNTAWNNSLGICEQTALPDLVPVFDLTGTFSVGTAIPLTAVVKNVGSTNVGNFSNNFSYWDGDNWIDINPYLVHPSLSAGGQATDVGSYSPTQVGTLWLQYCVDSYNQITNESSEANCTQVLVNVEDNTSGATLSGSGCYIQLGASDCDGKFTWDIQGPNPNVRNLTTNTQFSTSPTGNNAERPLQYGSNKVAARSNTNILKTVEVVASCIAGTAWNNGTCEFVQLSPQITIEATPGIIRSGQKATVIVGVTADYGMECTLSGVDATPYMFTYAGGSTEQTINRLTRPLSSAQIVQVSCTDGVTVTTKQARIDVIGTIQEI